MNRSYLFAPGHNKKLVGKVFDAGSQLPIIHAEFSPHEDELHWAPWVNTRCADNQTRSQHLQLTAA